ncbi:MAG: endonuclease/exonuclease/phosphatase family protein [Alphaproteobacteria bacterium]|nr:endonuclease/exonuclease/phosphatase family protein [Alphaproteobacteria bacterium]
MAFQSKLITHLTNAFAPLPQAAIDSALLGEPTRKRHDDALAQCPAFEALEYQLPRKLPVARDNGTFRLSVFSWNAERLKYARPSQAFLGSVLPDIALLTEVDIGMARSGNRHTVRELAEPLDYGYVYALEFAELGLGDDREIEWHKGQANNYGYHGNAILSRWPLTECFAVRLDDGAHWFIGFEQGDQRRIGFRNAVGARAIIHDQPLWCLAAHFENRATPERRADQARRLIAAIESKAGAEPIVIGGDFNTSALPTDQQALEEIFEDPSALEPMFAVFREAGFSWANANTREPTCRTRPDGTPKPPFTRIDWFFTRGFSAHDAATLPAIDSEGHAISDHEALRVTLTI